MADIHYYKPDTPPYHYQEFPRALYKHGEPTKTVTTEEDKAASLADGWYLTPHDAKVAADAPPAVESKKK